MTTSETAKTIAKLRAMAAEAREAGAIDVDDLLASAAAQLERATAWYAATPPNDAQGLAVICRLRCCHPGALIVITADRVRGQWVANIGHAVDFEMWRPLPGIPAILRAEGSVQ